MRKSDVFAWTAFLASGIAIMYFGSAIYRDRSDSGTPPTMTEIGGMLGTVTNPYPACDHRIDATELTGENVAMRQDYPQVTGAEITGLFQNWAEITKPAKDLDWIINPPSAAVV